MCRLCRTTNFGSLVSVSCLKIQEGEIRRWNGRDLRTAGSVADVGDAEI